MDIRRTQRGGFIRLRINPRKEFFNARMNWLVANLAPTDAPTRIDYPSKAAMSATLAAPEVPS